MNEDTPNASPPEASPTPKSPTPDDVATAMRVLQRLAEDRGLLSDMADDDRIALLQAASRVAFPSRAERRQQNRQKQKRRKGELAKQKQADEALLEQTGIRAQFTSVRQLKRPCPSAPFETTPPMLEDGRLEDGRLKDGQLEDGQLEDGQIDGTSEGGADQPKYVKLSVPRNCYICKRDYDRLHFFYDAMCPDCAAFNWTKRNQTADLSGRYAMVTGGRVKIGYQAALKLLRAGAHVIVTTRFPRDAASRFQSESDSAQWSDRLHVHGIDLRHAPSVEALADHLVNTLPRLDYVLNNACQTVRRPPGFYAHLMDAERALLDSLPGAARQMLASHDALASEGSDSPTADALSAEVAGSLAGIHRSAELSQLALLKEDRPTDGDSAPLFPAGQYDVDLQQVDLRTVNSWRLKLADVPTVELLEVHLVNAVAPFILNARLKPLMLKVPSRDKQIVNVSAMEGVFYRAYKTDKHPHTNMAKAALNMMTRTSAQDYAADGIYMNSVDTGWITDEDPADIANRKKEDLGFRTPLDQIDAAARICDPVFASVLTGESDWGKFLKDYAVANW